MFDFWSVYSGERIRASWPSCFAIYHTASTRAVWSDLPLFMSECLMFWPVKLPAARKEYIQISLRKRTTWKHSPLTSVDELTAPAKLRFIIRRMRYSCAAPSEYFPVDHAKWDTSEDADLQPVHAIRIATSNFDRFCCFFPWCLIVAIDNMPGVYNSFIIREHVRPLQWVSRKRALISRPTIRKIIK